MSILLVMLSSSSSLFLYTGCVLVVAPLSPTFDACGGVKRVSSWQAKRIYIYILWILLVECIQYECMYIICINISHYALNVVVVFLDLLNKSGKLQRYGPLPGFFCPIRSFSCSDPHWTSPCGFGVTYEPMPHCSHEANKHAGSCCAPKVFAVYVALWRSRVLWCQVVYPWP